MDPFKAKSPAKKSSHAAAYLGLSLLASVLALVGLITLFEKNIRCLFGAGMDGALAGEMPHERLYFTYLDLNLVGASEEDLVVDWGFEEMWHFLDKDEQVRLIHGRPFSRSDTWRWVDDSVRATWPTQRQSSFRYEPPIEDRRLWRSEPNPMLTISSVELNDPWEHPQNRGLGEFK